MKYSMKLKLLILGLVLGMVIGVSGYTLAANPSIPVNSYTCTLQLGQEKQIDNYLLQTMKTGMIPGMSVVIVKDGQPVYLKGLGCADLKAKTPVTPRTLFELGSNSKAFTALGILQLERQGRLRLNDPIRKYLPWLEVNFRGRAVDITLEQFLHHTSGIPFKTISYIPESSANNALEETVRKLINVELDSMPGTRHSYATINYDVLGLVIQKLSGQPFEEYMRINVLESLGMNQTYLFRHDIASTRGDASHGGDLSLAQGYKFGFAQALAFNAPVYRGNTPAGYFISNGEDITKWLNVQLGIQASDKVDQALIEKSHTPEVGQDYACGWYVNPDGSGIITHGGENPNYSSSLVLDKSENLGVAVLANLNSAFVNNAAKGIWRIMKGKNQNRPVFDKYQNLDGAAVKALYVLTPLLLLIILRFTVVIRQIGKGRRSFRKWGLKGFIVAAISCLLLAGYTCVIYLTPRALFSGLSWSFLWIWGPISFIMAVLELSCFVYLMIAALALPYFFPKDKANPEAKQTMKAS